MNQRMNGGRRGCGVAAIGGLALGALTGCAREPAIQVRPPAQSATAVPTLAIATPASRSGDVAVLMAHPPAAMTTVELDAYHGDDYMSWPGRGRMEAMTGCPSQDSSPLLDQPLWQTLTFANESSNNLPPSGAPWLIAASAPGVVEIDWPHFARFRGHLGDPAFAHCQDADRIFVVEAVVAVYVARRPDWLVTPDVMAWRTSEIPRFGVRLHHPADMVFASDGDDAWTLTSPEWPQYPLRLVIAKAAAESIATRDNRNVQPEVRLGGFVQHPPASLNLPNAPPLSGDVSYCNGDIHGGCVEVRFAHGGMVYGFRQDYGTGFELDPQVLRLAGNILDAFEIDIRATITPIPPPKTTLGPGPFWTRAQAERVALDMIGSAIKPSQGTWQIVDARLVPEAEALDLGHCEVHRDAENMGYAFPDGVWMVEMTAVAESHTLVYSTYLDATNGFHLCTAEKK